MWKLWPINRLKPLLVLWSTTHRHVHAANWMDRPVDLFTSFTRPQRIARRDIIQPCTPCRTATWHLAENITKMQMHRIKIKADINIELPKSTVTNLLSGDNNTTSTRGVTTASGGVRNFIEVGQAGFGKARKLPSVVALWSWHNFSELQTQLSLTRQLSIVASYKTLRKSWCTSRPYDLGRMN